MVKVGRLYFANAFAFVWFPLVHNWLPFKSVGHIIFYMPQYKVVFLFHNTHKGFCDMALLQLTLSFFNMNTIAVVITETANGYRISPITYLTSYVPESEWSGTSICNVSSAGS